ncbi:MAG: amino acid adenylation domain-containing protein [Asticcacaulis sp.]|uniref:amino acid adenylation domain-containing protein n=1 Tax=Asticcacaulis sp. TaxID=1872648 RepID=UPI0039E35DAD
MSDLPDMHLIGVGGTGMLPLALLLKQAGYSVSGSDDARDPARFSLLAEQGVQVSGAAPARVQQAGCVVASPAIPETHVERRAARREGIPVKTRARALAELIRDRATICVAGSHGKSTTTAMLIHILQAMQGDGFGYMLGASFPAADLAPARLGAPGVPFVMEACEAHGALDEWQPAHAILTNLDDDHADHYGGQNALKAAFVRFLSRLPSEGRAVVCGDDPGVRAVIAEAHCSVLTYGFDEQNQLRAVRNINGNATVFLKGEALGDLSLAVQGRHNLLNALAALGMALELGVDFAAATTALADFNGIGRRLQRISTPSSLRIFDDFAHHPAEITASLAALRETAPGRLVAIFEPQLNSRVSRMAPAFAKALSAADLTLVMPVATLGEAVQGRDGNTALGDACLTAGVNYVHVAAFTDLLARLESELRSDDTLVVMAGRSGEGLAQRLSEALSVRSVSIAPATVLRGEITPPSPDLLHIIASHTAAYPEAPAVEMGHRCLTYSALLARTGDLSHALAVAGVREGDCVAVCLGRTIDRVTAFLAILQLGGVFLPLDPALPAERQKYMLENAGARVVVVNAASPALPDIGLSFVNCGHLPERGDHLHESLPLNGRSSDALAYMIFTSGTTGRPKGVEVSRGSLVNYAVAACRHFGIDRMARVSQVCGFGFDVSVGDMAMALAAGACLVYPTDMQAVSGAPVGRFIAQARLSHLSLTPSALSIIPQGAYPDLTHVIVVGEACHPSLVERWGEGRCFINAYGPTEATVEVLFAICRPGEPVTIGRPFDNMGACLLDENLRPVAPGCEGELCLFGVGLANGYRHLPELTAERFPTIDIEGVGAVRIYRTGDRAKAGPDGNLIYLGRLDSQFKFHGYRIEPGDIEAALCGQPGILDAVVSLVSSAPAPDRLVAHIVMMPDMPPLDSLALRGRLEDLLPTYMVPSVILPVPDIPRNANGKHDREALPLPPQLTRPPVARTTGNATEGRIMALVEDLGGAGFIAGTRDSLIAAGMDSLSIANLLFAIEDTFNITLDTGFEAGFDTVEVLSLMVDSRRRIAHSPSPQGVEERLAASIMSHLATWPGQRQGRAGLVRSLHGHSPLPGLFWCFQNGQELAQLSAALEGTASVYGLRSGHLAVEYSAENLQGLGKLYADEITAIAPAGPLFLGGNCQGGLVMREAGMELMRRGRVVALTILMEQGRFPYYPGRTLLLFGAHSYLNPYGQIAAPEQIFRTAYTGGHRVEIIPGAHGAYFKPENVEGLASVIARHLKRHPVPELS